MAEMVEFLFDKDEKHCGKRRKCWLPAFSPFLTMFSKGFFAQGHVAKGKIPTMTLTITSNLAYKSTTLPSSSTTGTADILCSTNRFNAVNIGVSLFACRKKIQ